MYYIKDSSAIIRDYKRIQLLSWLFIHMAVLYINTPIHMADLYRNTRSHWKKEEEEIT